MNDRILLNLASIPTFTGSGLIILLSIILLPGLTYAKSIAPDQDLPSQTSCDTSIETLPAPLKSLVHSTHEYLVASSVESGVDYPMMDFSTAESNAAIALFNCDCLSCINALRQLRAQQLQIQQPQTQQPQTQALLNSNQPSLNQPNASQGHCWSSIQQQPQQQIQEVLQILEAEEGQEALERSTRDRSMGDPGANRIRN